MLKRKLFSSLTPDTRTAWGVAIATDCLEPLQLLNHLFSALDRNERTDRQPGCVWVPAQPWHRNAIQQTPSRSQKLGQSRVLKKGSIQAQKKLHFTPAPVSGGQDSSVAAKQSHVGILSRKQPANISQCAVQQCNYRTMGSTSHPHPHSPSYPQCST